MTDTLQYPTLVLPTIAPKTDTLGEHLAAGLAFLQAIYAHAEALREAGRREVRPLTQKEIADDPAIRAERDRWMLDIGRAVAALPDEQREIIRLGLIMLMQPARSFSALCERGIAEGIVAELEAEEADPNG